MEDVSAFQNGGIQDDRIKNWSSILERDWQGIVIFSMDSSLCHDLIIFI